MTDKFLFYWCVQDAWVFCLRLDSLLRPYHIGQRYLHQPHLGTHVAILLWPQSYKASPLQKNLGGPHLCGLPPTCNEFSLLAPHQGWYWWPRLSSLSSHWISSSSSSTWGSSQHGLKLQSWDGGLEGCPLCPQVNGGPCKGSQPHHWSRSKTPPRNPCPIQLSCSWWWLGWIPSFQGHHGVYWGWQCWPRHSSLLKQHWRPWSLVKNIQRNTKVARQNFLYKNKKKWEAFKIKQSNLPNKPQRYPIVGLG